MDVRDEERRDPPIGGVEVVLTLLIKNPSLAAGRSRNGDELGLRYAPKADMSSLPERRHTDARCQGLLAWNAPD